MVEEVIKGTELKFNLNIEPISDTHMADYDFKVVAYCPKSTGRLEVVKDECTKIDDDNYIVPIDTSNIGPGDLILDIYAYLPDEAFEDKLRTEIQRAIQDIRIIV